MRRKQCTDIALSEIESTVITWVQALGSYLKEYLEGVS